MKSKIIVILFITLYTIPLLAQSDYPFRNSSLSLNERVDDLLNRLTIEEKISLLIATANEIPRLDIDKYYHGNEALHGIVKAGRFTVFPQAIGLAATWNPDLIYDVATAISDEARGKWNFYNQGKDQLRPYSDLLTFWSPTVNMARDPRWGRTPETYGEDPFLTSSIGVSFVKGLQGNDEKYLKVVSTPKHFVANNEEHNRFECNAVISERALREYYLPAFRACIQEGKAQSIMSSYNAINGIPATSNYWLLTELLRNEWGFEGYVVSDCGAVKYVTTEHNYVESKEHAAKVSIEAGLDLECGDDVYKNFLFTAFEDGIVEEESIDLAARRVLEARFKLGVFDPLESNPYSKISPDVIGSEKHQKLAAEVARESIVLLKNSEDLLPLDKTEIKKIAVVGPNAVNIVFGDYSGLPVIDPISVFEGIENKVGAQIDVEHVRWKTFSKNLQQLDSKYLSNDQSEENGLYAEYYDDKYLEGEPQTRIDKVVDFEPVNQAPDPFTSARHISMRWTGYITPTVSGLFKIGVNSDDGIRLWLNDKLVIDSWYNRGATTDQVEIEMKADNKYSIKLEYFDNGGDAICQLFWEVPNSKGLDIYEEDQIAAAESDYIIAVMGINKSIEKEGRDRETLGLPEEQTDYLKKIKKYNKNIIVVLVAGSSMSINWIDENIPAIVDVWYPGESGGTAIADVLFGDFNPAGRLPFTFYKSIEDLLPMNDYEISKGRTYMYFEGDPLYPFGYGLSYSKFEYYNMSTSYGEDKILINVDVKNVSDIEGDEVVQLYFKDVESSVKRPNKKLIGFYRISLNPGEMKNVSFEVSKEQLTFWDEKTNQWQFEEGEFEFMIGASSEDIRQNQIFSIN